ncbi:hypothetical protein Z946_2760 [Sulfitobacter noctilucicola]|nr:hypothetical protein Z946_2098 [Sulfitobacter noctilucicola]KIN63886.1 hypothetical protein Z946_2760 [Sulfitobacter noctilucicola]
MTLLKSYGVFLFDVLKVTKVTESHSNSEADTKSSAEAY